MKLDYGVIGIWMGLGAAVFVQCSFNTLFLIYSDWQKAADAAVQRIEEEKQKLTMKDDSSNYVYAILASYEPSTDSDLKQNWSDADYKDGADKALKNVIYTLNWLCYRLLNTQASDPNYPSFAAFLSESFLK